VYVESPVTGGLVEAPGRQAILRSDNGHVMGIFTDGYEPHPYVEWLINTIATLLEDDLSIGSAGLLKNGAVAWVSVEVPDNITTPEGVEFRPHLFGATSFAVGALGGLVWIASGVKIGRLPPADEAIADKP